LELRLGHRVERVDGGDGKFSVHTRDDQGIPSQFAAKKIAVATGYYDLPNQMGIPGEDLPHVSHYYTEPHTFWRQNVVVIGGKNSAAEAALDLYRNGAKVTMVHRRSELGSTIKYWVRPDIENRIKAGQIRALFDTHVKRIEEGRVIVSNHNGESSLAACQVFALTGYHPDFQFLRSLGITLDPETNKPSMDPQTHESNVPGIYVAGVVIGGNHTSEIFIENGRFHGKQIVAALTGGRLHSTTGV
jgi:thioredoxin reductase (NADPH)